MKRIISLLLITAMLLSLTACGNKVVKVKTERVPGEVLDISKDKFTTVGEGSEMLLSVNAATGTLRWQNKSTGTYVDTRIFDNSITGSNSLALKSDVIATYFSGTESGKYETTSTMDSYTYGVEMDGNLIYEVIENGVRLVYTLGSDKVTYKDFPAYITQERMNELVLQYLDESQQKTVLKQYRLTMSGIYSRKTDENTPLAGMAAPQLYELFYNVGHYTYEELETDNTEYDKLDEMPSRASFDFTIDYYLDNNDLIVKIPTDELIENDEYPIKSLELLPYFMSSTSTDGYLFVPDGSGAIIYLDNNKKTEYRFTSRYYNGDLLVNADTYSSTTNTLTLPVYGIKSDDHAILGIIEEGAEIATLNTYINGYYSGIAYSRASLTFNIREEQMLAAFTSATSPYKLYKVSDDYYTGDIKVRYCYINGEDAGYSEMAHVYSEYLENAGVLSKNTDVSDDAAFYTELYGAVDKKMYWLGIPYEGTLALTTFNEAEEILSQLTAEGVKNIKVQYTGISNSGVNQRSVENVKILSALGGSSGLALLDEYAESIGAEIYPSFLLQTAVTSKGLSKAERSFFMNGKVAQIYDFMIVDLSARLVSDYPTYIVHPLYMVQYITKFLNSYNKLGLSNIASSDFMTFYSASYKKDENISMSNAKQYYIEALKLLSENNSVMLSNPIVDAYSEVDCITDLPTDNSKMKILDASVPFVQMVIDGYIEYSSERVNNISFNLHDELMKAIETRSAMKFTFMSESKENLEDTTLEDVFMAEYESWIGKVGVYYTEYNEFYKLVKNADILKHEIWNKNSDTVIVSYTNAIKVYLNYSDDQQVIDGVVVPADSYIIK